MFALRSFDKQLCDMHLGPGLPGLPRPSFQVPYPTCLGTEEFVALFPLATYVYTDVQEEEWAFSVTWRLLHCDHPTSLATPRGIGGKAGR